MKNAAKNYGSMLHFCLEINPIQTRNKNNEEY